MRKLLIALFLLSGCCSHGDLAAATLDTFRAYRGAAVPDASLDGEDREAWLQDGQDVEDALSLLAREE